MTRRARLADSRMSLEKNGAGYGDRTQLTRFSVVVTRGFRSERFDPHEVVGSLAFSVALPRPLISTLALEIFWRRRGADPSFIASCRTTTRAAVGNVRVPLL